MRVNSKAHFFEICSLRLDQLSFGRAREFVSVCEHMETLQQGIIFLKSCKREDIIPNCVELSLTRSIHIRPSKSLTQLENNTKKKLLSLLIRSNYSELNYYTRQRESLTTKLPNDEAENIIKIGVSAGYAERIRRKTILIRKFNNLQIRDKSCWEPPHQHTHISNTEEDYRERVTILGDFSIDDKTLKTLAKGPKFIPTPSFTKERLQQTMQIKTAALAYSMRWKAALRTRIGEREHSPSANDERTPYDLYSSCPFPYRRSEPPRDDPDTEKTIHNLQHDIQRLVERFDIKKIKQNTTREEYRCLKTLRERERTQQ